MGDIAEMMLDGILDEQTGEYLGKGVGYPRTLVKGQYNTIRQDNTARNKIRAIRKELAILIKEKQQLCTTEKQKNNAVSEGRQEINLKYGKGWRTEGLF